MTMKSKLYYDGEVVMDFCHHVFEKDLRKAPLVECEYPDQRMLSTPLDEALWILWVMRDYFEHRIPITIWEVSHALEIRGVALGVAQARRTLAHAGRKVIRRKFDKSDKDYAYMISEKGVDYLKKKYATSEIKALVFDGNKPWTDRHLKLPEIAAELKGCIRVVDKFYGSGCLGILHYFKHGTPLQFLTGKAGSGGTTFNQELKDFQKEVPTLEVRVFPAHHELHDRYIISDDALVIVGHGIKDMGNKESFLILLKGDSTADLRKTLLEKFEARWKISAPFV